MKAKDYRREAWGNLKGKWGTMALAAFIAALITGVGGACFGIGALIVSGPLALGASVLAISVARRKEVKTEMLFDGFKTFGKSFVLWLLNGILVALWSLLLVIPGIIKSLSYSMSYFVMLDNPELSANEARKKSMQIMKGNKWKLFCLLFSFIGWYILSIFTLGILMFWIRPYVDTATVEFYKNLTGDTAATAEPENV